MVNLRIASAPPDGVDRSDLVQNNYTTSAIVASDASTLQRPRALQDFSDATGVLFFNCSLHAESPVFMGEAPRHIAFLQFQAFALELR